MCKFARDTNLGELAETLECHAAIQRDFVLMQFGKGKCKFWHLGKNNIIN